MASLPSKDCRTTNINMDDFWHVSKTSEVILLRLSYNMARKMVCSYFIPFLKRMYPVISNTIAKTLFYPSKFSRNKAHISSLVKTVYEKVKIYVVSDAELCNDIITNCMFGAIGIKFIGLDCEWESEKKNGVALIQISSGNHCLLYRPFNSDVFPENLKLLLEDHNVLKFGVGIDEDARRLSSYGIFVNGYVDLRNLAQRCLPQIHGNESYNEEEDMLRWTSLRSLSLNALDLRLNKNWRIQCSKWEADILTLDQILYAAKDAIVSLEVFYVLVLLRKVSRNSISILSDAFEKEMELNSDWNSKYVQQDLFSDTFLYSHAKDQFLDVDVASLGNFESTKPSAWLIDLARSLCQGIIDRKHLNKTKNKKSLPSKSKPPKTSKLKEYKHQCRDKPLYENCFLKGPDGSVLATVNRSKASWYVHKNLGEVTCEEPYTVNLFFEPSGRPMPDADYYTTIKDNVCVVCEGTESFVRKNIIPHDYRRYFPLELKDHMSHDVLLMCLNCHRIAQRCDEQKRQELAVKCNAPLGTKDQRMHLENPLLSKVKSAAKALHYNGAKIPEARAKELRDVIENYCRDEEVTDDVIKRLSDMDIKIKNETFGEPHGQRVVNSFVRENKLPEFIRMWRQNFLTNMQPKHLPPMWSVEHNLDKLRAVKVTSV